MATPAQISANQANARHSTGPRTQAGKSASARNSTRHGFRSQSVLLPGDDPGEYDAVLEELRVHFDPKDLTEDRCVREMADAEWRLRRVRGYIELDLTRKVEELTPVHPAVAALELQLLAYQALQRELAAWLRYESKFERQYDRAYRTWTQYQEGKDKRAKADFWNQLLAVPAGPRRPAGKPLPATPQPDTQIRTSEPNSAAESTPPQTEHSRCGVGTDLVSEDERRKSAEDGTDEANLATGFTLPQTDHAHSGMGTDLVSEDNRRKESKGGTSEPNSAASSTLLQTEQAPREMGTDLVSEDKKPNAGENGTSKPNSKGGTTLPQTDQPHRGMGTDLVSGDKRRSHGQDGTNKANLAERRTPRNAPCPCGSGQKYKRCCGRHAPAVLSAGG